MPINVAKADSVNLVQNSSFESGLDNWTIVQAQSNIASIDSSGKPEEIKSGDNFLAIYYSSSYILKVSQSISNIPNGIYFLTVYAEVDQSDDNANIQLFASDYGEAQITTKYN